MEDATKKRLLKYLLFAAVILVIGIIIYLFAKGKIFKKESFQTSDNYESDFDYVVSFIKNIVGI
jgi:hypothetical protein